MKNHKFFLLVACLLGFVTLTNAQKRVNIKNGIGFQGGITQYDILTDQFATKAGSGWIGGMNATVTLPHKWYTVSYSLLLSENNVEISGRTTQEGIGDETLEYKLMAAQLGFTFHVKLLSEYLMLELGPQVQYNSKLELTDDAQEGYFINGYDTLQAEMIEDITRLNVNGMVGASLGFNAFKIRAQYSYGLTNMLNKLNDADFAKGLSTDFKGNQSMVYLTAMITF